MVKIDRELRMTARSILMSGMREMHGHLELLLMTVTNTLNEKVQTNAGKVSECSNSFEPINASRSCNYDFEYKHALD